MKKLRIINPKDRFRIRKEIIYTYLNDLFVNAKDPLRILEAGCGKRWGLTDIKGDYKVTGVDISKKALEDRMNIEKDLDEYQVGDLRYIKLKEAHFDVVYSNFVLEHINGAETVMKNFHSWLKPGGIIILQIPDNKSTAVFFSRITPHLFHVLYYRYIKKRRNAGRPGHGPFKTYYDKILTINEMRKFAEDNNLNILSEVGIMSPYKGFSMFSRFLSLLSFGYLSHNHNGLLYVLQMKG